MNEITQKEQAAIWLERARARGVKLSINQRRVINAVCSDFIIETVAGKYAVKKFFGKLYLIG